MFYVCFCLSLPLSGFSLFPIFPIFPVPPAALIPKPAHAVDPQNQPSPDRREGGVLPLRLAEEKRLRDQQQAGRIPDLLQAEALLRFLTQPLQDLRQGCERLHRQDELELRPKTRVGDDGEQTLRVGLDVL